VATAKKTTVKKTPRKVTEARTSRATISITPSEKERLAKFAEANNWSVSTAASWLIEKGLKEFVAPVDIIDRSLEIKRQRGNR
jgi:hypothetical protein